MQTPLALYIASILGAIALVLIMPKQRWNARLLGGLLGAAALGGLWLVVAPETLSGMPWSIFAYYYVFSAIAIVAAVRVITHTRPVYSALWFVMVVLSSAGLFLILSAEFMAFAMVIIYAGAILVTYMFVIMLATQSQPDDAPEVSPSYDRLAREPLGAVVAGFLLLAVLLSVTFEPMEPTAAAAGPTDAALVGTVLAETPPLGLERGLAERTSGEATAELTGATGDETLTNAERVGLDLFRAHPLGLELAGVILLVSLIGAVVIAKTHVPEEDLPTSAMATVRPRHEPGPKEPEAIGRLGGRSEV